MTKAERLERDIKKLAEMKAHEDELRVQGNRYIAGIDEVGRGPLAGPVYTACVVLPEDFDVPGVNDSKKLSAKRREELSEIILDKAVAYGIGIADNNEIDEINILEATKTAMKRAVDSCNEVLESKTGERIDLLLIDAVKLDIDTPSESIIKGDEKSLSIAAASIVAKVARDRFMTDMDDVYPGYDFAGNKGYGTAKHYEGLRSLGYTPIHRRSFLRKFEEEQKSGKAAWGNMAKKIYAVKNGRKTGIFTSWDDCKSQVAGYPGAEYKGFNNVQDAASYLGVEASTIETAIGGSSASSAGKAEGSENSEFTKGVRAYVDGSYDISTGRYSCGVVMLRIDEDGNIKTRELNQAFDDEEAAKQRNVAGEIMGAKLAIDFCLRNNIDEVEIYHDYEGVGKWADDLWKANNPLTKAYKSYVAKARTRMKIRFVKVKAHAGNEYNEIADKLAKSALGI